MNWPANEFRSWVISHLEWVDSDVAPNIANLNDELEQLIGRLVSQNRQRRVNLEDGKLSRKVTDCLEYHWKRFSTNCKIEFEDVVARLESGSLSGGSVNANILQDVVLAQGLAVGDERAAETFETDFMPIVRGIAGKVGGHRAIDSVDNFSAELVLPRGDKPCRIDSFQGKTSLACWLRPVVMNHWISLTRKKSCKRRSENVAPGGRKT